MSIINPMRLEQALIKYKLKNAKCMPTLIKMETYSHAHFLVIKDQ